MRIGVVTFPGTLDDRDALRAVRLGGAEPVALWHGDDDLRDVEAIVLPGAMIKNAHRSFICRDQPLRVENVRTAWTTDYQQDQVIRVPLKNQDGQYVADERTLAELEAEGRVVFRYTAGATHGPAGFESNPNGSRNDIAGITNAEGNEIGRAHV